MNIRYFALLAIIILLAAVAFADTKLKKVQITKEVSVMLPRDFLPMPDDGIARKYPATTKPLAVYTSPNGQIDMSVTQKRSQFRPQDLGMLREFYKSSLQEKFSKVDYIRDEIVKINGKEFIVFEVVSTLADERKGSNLSPVQRYSIFQYTIQGNQLYIFTLHTPFMLKKDFQPTAHKIMSSIKVK